MKCTSSAPQGCSSSIKRTWLRPPVECFISKQPKKGWQWGTLRLLGNCSRLDVGDRKWRGTGCGQAWTLQKLNAISATSTLCSMDGAAGVWPRALCVYEQTEEADVVTLAATLGICAQGSQHGADNAAWCCAWHLLELAQRQREDLVALSPACTSLTSSASRAKQWRLALESLALGR
eukprot:s8_g38.t2